MSLAIALAAIATWFDLRERRIPNWLCAVGAAAGVALNWREGLLGAGLALAIYLPLYFLRGVGAGDVKLMAAVGALVGPLNWVGVFALSAVVGGVLALIAIWRRQDKLPVAPRVLVGVALWWLATASPLANRGIPNVRP